MSAFNLLAFSAFSLWILHLFFKFAEYVGRHGL
jgi:hypothetical protein